MLEKSSSFPGDKVIKFMDTVAVEANLKTSLYCPLTDLMVSARIVLIEKHNFPLINVSRSENVPQISF